LINKFEEEVHAALCKEFGKNNVAYEPLQFLYTTEHFYTPDFAIYEAGRKDPSFFVEAKGYFRPEHKRTILAVRDQHDIDLRLCFQKNQKISKQSNNRYSDWADKWGFQYCIGSRSIKDIV